MAFFYHLFTFYRQFKKTGSFPKCNASWISRAIYAQLAFILLSEQSAKGQSLCDFVSATWFSNDVWFSSKLYNQDNYNNLAKVCKNH